MTIEGTDDLDLSPLTDVPSSFSTSEYPHGRRIAHYTLTIGGCANRPPFISLNLIKLRVNTRSWVKMAWNEDVAYTLHGSWLARPIRCMASGWLGLGCQTHGRQSFHHNHHVMVHVLFSVLSFTRQALGGAEMYAHKTVSWLHPRSHMCISRRVISLRKV